MSFYRFMRNLKISFIFTFAIFVIAAFFLVLPNCSAYRSAMQTSNGTENGQQQTKDVTFTRLKIAEVEKQKSGSIREEQAVSARDIIFKDSSSWHDFWAKYTKEKIQDVDFGKFHVAAVFLGPKPSSGHSVEIKKVIYQPDRNHTKIYVSEKTPASSGAQLTVMVYPADVVMFPAQPGTVQFVHEKEE